MSEKTAGTAATSDGRDTRWAGHRAERRDLILSAAVAAIEEGGDSVGVAGIADAAGVPRSVVYRLFKDRGDLDEQIRARIIDDLMVGLTPTLDPKGSVGDAIRSAVETYVGWVAAHPRLHRFLGMGSPSRRTDRSQVARGTRTAIALDIARLLDVQLERLLDGAPTPPGTADNLAFGMIGLVDGAVNRWVANPDGHSSSEDLVDFLSDALWSVLRSTADRVGVRLEPDQPLVPDGATRRGRGRTRSAG